MPAGSVSGSRNPISTWPLRRRCNSSDVGLRTLTTASADHGSPESSAPASRYASSGNAAATPAPGSTTTLNPPRRAWKRLQGQAPPGARPARLPAERRFALRDSTYVPWPRVTHFIVDYGLWFLFGIVCLESAGLWLPGETALIAAGVYAAKGKLSIAAVIVRRRGGRDHRGQHRLLARTRARPEADLPLRLAGAHRRPDPASRRTLLPEARRQGRLLRALLRRRSSHRCVDGGNHAHVLVAVPLLERTRRHRLGDARRARRVLRRQGGRRRDRSLWRVRRNCARHPLRARNRSVHLCGGGRSRRESAALLPRARLRVARSSRCDRRRPDPGVRPRLRGRLREQGVAERHRQPRRADVQRVRAPLRDA